MNVFGSAIMPYLRFNTVLNFIGGCLRMSKGGEGEGEEGAMKPTLAKGIRESELKFLNYFLCDPRFNNSTLNCKTMIYHIDMLASVSLLAAL